ncbi:diphthine synthase [Candidatus Woesearchaeota archaeon]|nr:MAG: diphthine synthase [archaeon GW2011_AR4]MBS3130339.1 diphthine synthase [Candidatus Woesearchaeota archaeon]HIH38940.1 diphthine synthase [Candidatus Woesearchaeota archaeon]HIJ03401.1 diphthine synthase [Candidatus Woesearchaeota archaeon]
MTLYLIGIGLSDAQDITLKGLETIRKCHSVYLEGYTSLMSCSIDELEKVYGKKIVFLKREDVENEREKITLEARTHDVALLIIGDVFSATTHADIILDSRKKNVSVKVIFNASIMTAIGITGLQLYTFGKTVSIPYPSKGFAPDSFFEGFLENKQRGLHTLFLLDIKADEGRYMSVPEAIALMIAAAEKRKNNGFTKQTLCVGCARLGCGDMLIRSGTAEELLGMDFGKPPHCLIVPGDLHFIEEEMLEIWKG